MSSLHLNGSCEKAHGLDVSSDNAVVEAVGDSSPSSTHVNHLTNCAFAIEMELMIDVQSVSVVYGGKIAIVILWD